MLYTDPLVVTYSDLPNDLDTFPGPILPQGAVFCAVSAELSVAWDNPVDSPELRVYVGNPGLPDARLSLQNISDPALVGPDPNFSAGQIVNTFSPAAPYSSPFATTLQFRSDNSMGPPTAGQLALRILYLTAPTP